jgi:hypothetical protein
LQRDVTAQSEQMLEKLRRLADNASGIQAELVSTREQLVEAGTCLRFAPCPCFRF